MFARLERPYRHGMKQCSRCGQTLDQGEFNRSSRNRDGLQGYCRGCQSAHYRSNAARHRKNVRRTSAARLAEAGRIVYVNLAVGCVDCGNTDIRVLCFDHVRGEKVDHIARMVRHGRGLDVIRAEIAKCEVRCHNRHAIVTAERRPKTWFDDFIDRP
jgi:hypothetical protein